MAYDPCSCLSQGEFELVFETIETMDIDILSRSISVEEPINNTNYRNKDFLNLSDIDGEEYKPGTRIYKEMDGLLNSYKAQLSKYNSDLIDYKNYNNNLTKNFVDILKSVVSNGVSASLPYGQLAKFLAISGGSLGLTKAEKEYTTNSYIPLSMTSSLSLIDGDQFFNEKEVIDIRVEDGQATWRHFKFEDLKKDLNKNGKKVISSGVDFLSGAIRGKAPSIPKLPNPSVATFEESIYKGTIKTKHKTKSASLFIPGSIPSAYEPNRANINAHNYPAYNEAMGLFALLKTPSLYMSENHSSGDRYSRTEINYYLNSQGEKCPKDSTILHTKYDERKITFKLKEPLSYSLNPALDFDRNKTEIFVQYEFEIDRRNGDDRDPLGQISHNLTEVHRLKTNENTRRHIYVSQWVPIQLSGEILYSFTESYGLEYMLRKSEVIIGSIADHTQPCGRPWRTMGNNFFPNIESNLHKIKIKLMLDAHFHQIGSDGEQVNQTQVFTYELFNSEEGIDKIQSHGAAFSMAPHTKPFNIGKIVLNSQQITPHSDVVSYATIGKEIFINAEEIVIRGDITVKEGFRLNIQGIKGVTIEPGGRIGEDISIRQKFFYEFPAPSEVDQSSLVNYCRFNQIGDYLANNFKRDENQINKSSPEAKDSRLNIKAYPNPIDNLLTVELTTDEIGEFTIQITDLKGKQIIAEKVTSQTGYIQFQIDFSNYPNAMYQLQIQSPKGYLNSKKLIKI